MLFLWRGKKRAQFLGELINILKTPINRGEANICDFIETTQAFHNDLPDLGGSDLIFFSPTKTTLDLAQ